ncbi:MAG: CDP-alcohol phosphatidyltransferase family protein [Hyphomicrobiales bacterium]
MASIYDLKPRFQNRLRPITASLARRGVTANQVTLGACILSVFAALILAVFYMYRMVFLILPFVLFIRMALNAIDGMLAREYNQASRLGAILNEVCDVISDTALALAFIPLLYFEALPIWPLLLFVMLSIFNEFCGLLGHAVDAGRRYEGPGGKSDRAFILGLVATLIALFGSERAVIEIANLGIFAGASALIVLSCWNRLRAALAKGQQ